MFRFAIKNMAIKKVQVILVVLSIVISAGVGVLAFNTAEQVSDGITGTAAYYSAIVGPAGSKTQLAMNTMYFTDSPLGTIPYSVVSDLQKDSRVTEVVPFAMADSYNGHSVVGSTSAFLSEKAIAEGRMFDDSATFEVVLGAAVARVNGVKVGDEIHTSHSVGDEHHEALTVVGILEESHTVYDNVVFTQLRTIWEVHEHEEEEETHDAAEGEEEEHAHAGEETVCAILVRTKNPGYAMQLVNEYDGKVITTQDLDTFTLQAIEPMDTVRGILEETNNTKYIVFVLCAIILVMNIMIISIITLLNMYHSAKEISLMRLIGISMKKINLLYIIQNSLIGLVSIMLAFGVSRLCLVFMKDYVASMGVVLNVAKVYPLEIVILLGVFLISVLPTVVCTFMMSGKDGISE
ncbi:MAG: ABC transporter permease [Clostridiales bacterium]|nr:ABC transporter permease [Clostridiales bacterium]